MLYIFNMLGIYIEYTLHIENNALQPAILDLC